MTTTLRDLLSELSQEARPVDMYERATAAAARQRRQRIAAGAAFGVVLAAVAATTALGPARPTGEVADDAPTTAPASPTPISPAPTAPTPSVSSSPSARPPSTGPAPASLRYFVGSWYGHGRQVTVHEDLTASWRGRTYVACNSPTRLTGEPCDDLSGGTIRFGYEELTLRLERSGDTVVAVVIESNNPGNGVGTTYRWTRHPRDHYFTVTWVSGGHYDRTPGFEYGMCSDDTPIQVKQRVCGA
jgi:hypothetical protein